MRGHSVLLFSHLDKKYTSTPSKSLREDKCHVPLCLGTAAAGNGEDDVNWERHVPVKGGSGYSFPADCCNMEFNPSVVEFLTFWKSPETQLLNKNLLYWAWLFIRHYNGQSMHSACICLLGHWFAALDYFSAGNLGLQIVFLLACRIPQLSSGKPPLARWALPAVLSLVLRSLSYLAAHLLWFFGFFWNCMFDIFPSC